MKTKILILLTLFCTILFTRPAPALMKNEPEDFRGIPWFAQRKSAIDVNEWGLKKTERVTVTTIFQRNNEKLQIGAAQLKSIEYLFLDNVGLVQVVVSVEKAANIKALLKSCTENWGEPENRLYTTYTWVGEKTRAELWTYKEEDSADLFIKVTKMSALVEEQEKLVTEKSKIDF